MSTLLDGLTDKDLLITDIGVRVLKPLCNYLNEKNSPPTLIKLFGSIDGVIKKVNFPVLEVAAIDKFIDMDMQALFQASGFELTEGEKIIIGDATWRLEYILLLAYAARKANLVFTSKDQLLKDMAIALNNIDGDKDIFIGNQYMFAFNKNENILKLTYLYQIPPSLQSDHDNLPSRSSFFF